MQIRKKKNVAWGILFEFEKGYEVAVVWVILLTVIQSVHYGITKWFLK